MKLKLMTFSIISALSLGSFVFAQNPEERGRRGGGNRHGVLETTTERLNLTPEQQAKVQPIIDQTNPQIQAVRREAMQKIKTLVDNAMAQIRPMLTPDQQKLLDESQQQQQQRRGGRRSGLKSRGNQQEQSDQDEGDQ
jgi:Spy/CpxP family protein refolding chaperone